ncbi:Ig-like domain-containing domain [Reichenbachiella sp. MALMAid0571]|uniref:Ig-like domain-containing domain n=1 Tax=Reichenbachiella sp. MALMAid0571 TaxID=3143939 RepID=UPI0032DEF1C3
MKHIFPFIILAIIFYVSSCANQGSPTGGPRDTIPPTLLESNPPHKSKNYKKQVFEFTFDERINADQLRTKMNITPHTENKFKVLVKKDILNITFDGAFDDSTTYTFNFADGVGDLTEKNPVINFTYAFSTGSIIDSIYVNGKIKNLYNNEPLKEILVGLYSIDDSLNLFTGKPRYFTHTDEEGNYKIENIKAGNYRIYAYEDQDKNLKNNPQKEKHGFIADTLNLFTSKDSVNILLQLIDASELKFVRAKNTGIYFDVLYNKFIKNYSISKIDSTKKNEIPANSFFKDNTIIRFYPDGSIPVEKDSLQIKIQSSDSLGNSIIDTVYVQFKETKRKAEGFQYTVSPDSKYKIQNNIKFKLDFSKPIKTINIDSLTLSYDTLKTINIPDSIINWNQNKTVLIFQLNLDKHYIPNQIKEFENEQIRLDSITQNNSVVPDTLRKKKQIPQALPVKNKITFIAKKGAFISIENDTTESVERSYEFLVEEKTGKIIGQIETEQKSYFLQLVDSKYNVIAQLKSPQNFTFNNVEPGKYSFRVLIDENNDGIWSSGNILKNIQQEPILFPLPFSDLKAGWEQDLTGENKIKF